MIHHQHHCHRQRCHHHHHHDREGASAKPGIRGYQHESSLDRAAYQEGKPHCNEMMIMMMNIGDHNDHPYQYHA